MNTPLDTLEDLCSYLTDQAQSTQGLLSECEDPKAVTQILDSALRMLAEQVGRHTDGAVHDVYPLCSGASLVNDDGSPVREVIKLPSGSYAHWHPSIDPPREECMSLFVPKLRAVEQ